MINPVMSDVLSKVDQYPTFSAVDAAIGEQGWKLVLLLRLAPVIPFNLLNYALALTKVTTHILIQLH